MLHCPQKNHQFMLSWVGLSCDDIQISMNQCCEFVLMPKLTQQWLCWQQLFYSNIDRIEEYSTLSYQKVQDLQYNQQTAHIPMQKQVILELKNGQFPFGQFESSKISSQPGVRPMVRDVHSTKSLHSRRELLNKMERVRSMPNASSLIEIESVLEEQACFHLIYQYVPIRMIDYIEEHLQETATADFMATLQTEVYALAGSLVYSGILCDWNIENIGLTENMDLKYFLDLRKTKIIDLKDSGDQCFDQLKVSHENRIAQMFFNLNWQSVASSLQFNQQVEAQRSISHNLLDLVTFKESTDLPPNQSLNHNSNSNSHDNAKMAASDISKWKQIDQNSEIFQDFINVLGDQDDTQSLNFEQPQKDSGTAQRQMKNSRGRNTQHPVKNPSDIHKRRDEVKLFLTAQNPKQEFLPNSQETVLRPPPINIPSIRQLYRRERRDQFEAVSNQEQVIWSHETDSGDDQLRQNEFNKQQTINQHQPGHNKQAETSQNKVEIGSYVMDLASRHQQQEIVWIDALEIRKEVEFAINRSKQALTLFKKVTGLDQVRTGLLTK